MQRSSPDQTLPASERVRGRADFLRIQRTGRRITSRHLLVFVMSSERSVPRLGVTVSRRVGKAVQRNRVKRLLREVFRQQKQKIPMGVEMVLIARPEAVTATYHQLFQELDGVCQRVSQWR